MRKLLLMRHAKSRWDNPDLSDFERPLNSRGLEVAPLMGRVLYSNELKPNLLVSSTAKRAKQTAILVKESAQVTHPVQYVEKIYQASATTLLNVVAGFSDTNETVLLVGHNPGMEEFIRILTGDYCSMPTGSIAKILLNITTWQETGVNKGFLETVFRPREIMNREKPE